MGDREPWCQFSGGDDCPLPEGVCDTECSMPADDVAAPAPGDGLTVHVIHVAGLDVQVGPIRRQRCAWCGALIQEDDLTRMSWMLNADGSDPGPPGMWPVGALVGTNRIDGTGATWVVDHEDGADVPDGCCAKLDPTITGG